MELWAHSTNRRGDRHSLVEHLRGTAELAARFAEPFGGGELAYWLGLSHDCGKASRSWQDGLLVAEGTGRRVGVDHKSLAVRLALDAGAVEAAYVLHGHHGGLVNRAALRACMDDNGTPSGRERWAQAEAALRAVLPEIFGAPPRVPERFRSGDRTAVDFLVRFLFSCLVDADGIDTQAHRMGWPGPNVGPPLDAELLWRRLLDRRRQLLSGRPANGVGRWREVVFDSAVQAAGKPPGLFRLTAPTGTGKTIAAAGFGLRHAWVHGKSRMIVAVPYITITEQNARVYRDLLDPPPGGDSCGDSSGGPGGAGVSVVLEQHSQVDLDGPGPRRRWQRLAAENWDAPFVVTTTVQLFESLFGRRPAQMRKVHRLAGAVIVLDEVQALPHGLLPEIADALRLLTTHFGATVVLSSATQPELSALGPLAEVEATEIVADPKPMFTALGRVRYRWWPGSKPTLAQVVDEAAAQRQVLVVVNAVKDARLVFEHARIVRTGGGLVAHLSTAMCPAHRRRVLADVSAALAAREPVFVVATQLIEAGVDVDFPVVYRAVAPPDSVQQAAGRANREGSLGPEGGLVVVFDPVDGGMPTSYRTQIGQAAHRFGPGLSDPDDLDALKAYFRSLYITLNLDGPGSRSREIRRNRCRHDFVAVSDGPDRGQGLGRDRARAFRMIDDDTVPVVVPYQDGTFEPRWVDELRGAADLDRRMFTRLQPYTTTIRRRTRERPEVAARCRPIVGDLVEWIGGYDQAGLVLEPEKGEFIA
jgi:CRISPR-associated endonuclease/helicase Cas3